MLDGSTPLYPVDPCAVLSGTGRPGTPAYDPLATWMLLMAIITPELGPRYTWPGHKRVTRPVTRTTATGRYRRTFDGALAPRKV